MFGQQLLQSGHYASVEVQEKLEKMNDSRQELERLPRITFANLS